MREQLDSFSTLEDFVEAVRDKENIIFITGKRYCINCECSFMHMHAGAGVSVSCGIPGNQALRKFFAVSHMPY